MDSRTQPDDAVVNPNKSSAASANPINAFRQVTILSLSFCLIFTAYASAQNYATSRDKHIGSVSLGILYATFTFTNILASAVLGAIGAKTCLIIGSLAYGGFVAANISFTAPIMFPMSAVIGAGAAILWTAQGAYVTRCSQYHEQKESLLPGSSVGAFNGLFWSIFQVSQFGGNLLVALLFHFDLSDHTVFVIMTCVCFVGSSGLLFLTPMEQRINKPNSLLAHDTLLSNSAAAPNQPAIAEPNAPKKFSLYSLIAPLGLLADRKMQLIIPAIIYSGTSQGFIFGDFPPLISDKQWKFFVMAAFGAADVASSILLGKASDKIGRKAVLCIGFVVHMTAFLVCYFYKFSGSEYGVFFPVAMLFGVGDGVFNTQLYAMIGVLYDDNTDAAFACFKFLQAGSTAAAFLYDDAFGNITKLYIVMGFLLVAIPLIFLLDWAVTPIDAAKDKKPASTAESVA